MIIFKEIWYQNFMSTGSIPIKFNLDGVKTTLIQGGNGHGKSSILDALCFAMFGKAYRNINKNQLINSINGKNCLVTLWFSIGKREYKIVRGIKPGIFEIWCDDVLMNKDAALKDYQKSLEQQILKFNYKTFTQVVIIGSSSFVPFMKLPAQARRDVIDELLDIRVFTVMGALLKLKITATKESLTEINNELKLAQTKVKNQQKAIKLVTDNKKEYAASLRDKIEYQQSQIDILSDDAYRLVSEIEELMPKLDGYDTLEENLRKLSRLLIKKDAKVSYLDENIKFFINNEVCPQCSQGIAHEHKESIISQLESEKTTHVSEFDIGRENEEKFNEKLSKLKQIKENIQSKQIELSSIRSGIEIHKSTISGYKKELESLAADKDDIEAEKALLRKIANEALVLLEHKKQLDQSRLLQDVGNVLLKDSGIKTAIIREYLPIMNKLINKNLSVLDAYIKFDLDENFNEIISSRHRDTFSYENFSDGEKLRIDLALLFAWRNVAKLKNSISTNLMFLDEMDKSLDAEGVELMLNLLTEASPENTNIFNISHKDNISEKFDRVVKFEKVGDFSNISVDE